MGQKGFTLIEVLIAMSIMAVLMASLTTAVLFGQNGSRLVTQKKQAVELAQNMLGRISYAYEPGAPEDVTYYRATIAYVSQLKLIGTTENGPFQVDEPVQRWIEIEGEGQYDPSVSGTVLNIPSGDDDTYVSLTGIDGDFTVGIEVKGLTSGAELTISSILGAFTRGEELRDGTDTPRGYVIDSYASYLTVYGVGAQVASGDVLTGQDSGAEMEVTTLDDVWEYSVSVSRNDGDDADAPGPLLNKFTVSVEYEKDQVELSSYKVDSSGG